MDDGISSKQSDVYRELIDNGHGDLNKVREGIKDRFFIAPLESKYSDATHNFRSLIEEAANEMRHYFRFDFYGDRELAAYIESKFRLGCSLSSNFVFLDVLDVDHKSGDLANDWKERLRTVETTLRKIDSEYAREISRQEKFVVEHLTRGMANPGQGGASLRSTGIQAIGSEFNIDFSSDYPHIRQEIHRYVFEFMQTSLHSRASYLSWMLRGYRMCIREVVCTEQTRSIWSMVISLYCRLTRRPYVETTRRFFLATSLVLDGEWFKETCHASGYCLSTLSPYGSIIFIRDDTVNI